MSTYAIFENTSSTAYGSNSSRPIYAVINASEDQVIDNTPTGYTYVACGTDVQVDTHYVYYDSGTTTFEVLSRQRIWDAGWFLFLYINGSQVTADPIISGDPDSPGAIYTVDTYPAGFWTANGTALVRFNEPSLGTTITVSSDNAGRWLVENGQTFAQTATPASPFANMDFTTTLGQWYETLETPGPTIYRFELRDHIYFPCSIVLRAS